jgi:hypothetical protein
MFSPCLLVLKKHSVYDDFRDQILHPQVGEPYHQPLSLPAMCDGMSLPS